MKKHAHFLITLAFTFIIQSLTLSQNFPDYKFRTFSPEGGLGYGGVRSIKQDKVGFMWILMGDELFRFDGYTYKRYSNQLKKIDYYSFKWILNCTEEDLLGNLYLGTANGLFIYNRKNDNFERLLPNYISKMTEDNLGNLWIINQKGAFIFDKEKKVLNLVEPQKETNRNGSTVLCSDNGKLILGKDRGRIYQLIYNRMEFKLIYTLPVISDIVDLKKMNDTLWILTEDQGLWMLNLKTLQIEQTYTFFCQKGYEKMPAKALFVDKNNCIWIGTQKGLYLLNPQYGNHTLYTRSDADFFSLPNNSIWNLNKDLQGNLWIGTYSGGVSYVNFKEASRFKTVSVQSSKLSHNVISGFAEQGNNVWIGTEGSGLFSYNKLNGVFTQFRQLENQNSLAYDNVKALLLKNNQYLWIGMFRGGLDCLDLKTGKFKNYNDKEPQKRILDNHINKLEAEADSGIWIGYQDIINRLTYFSLKHNVSDHYTFNIKGSQQIVGSIIKDFTRDNENNLWIATHERLHVMNVKTRKIKVVPIISTNSKGLSTMNIETLYWNKNDQSIWMGTNNKGLIKYEKRTGRFYYFNDILNFNAHSIYSISCDSQKNLWLGTDNGLFKFDTHLKRFFRFDKKDGVQGHIFYPRACLSSKTGELYFGGTEGFSIINPENIKNNTFNPQIIISNFFIDNNPITTNSKGSPLNEAISIASEITLNYNQRDFGFEFSSTNYLIPEKVRFKYRLNGYDNHWIEVDASRRYASYAKVPAGKYTFEIVATNNDGVWSDTYKEIKIRVLPAPWNSWWAYLLYAVLLFTVGYSILFYYLRHKRLKMELYLETCEMKRQEENHQGQLRFFTNISHEFKTPLSLILGTLERIKQEAIQLPERHFTIMGNNARRLLNLINELMDFRAVENGKMNLKISSGSINDFVIEIASDFKEYALQRNINFQLISDPALNNPVWLDKQVIEKIIMNLLNNAFKYTTSGYVVIETISDISKFNSVYYNSYFVNDKKNDLPMFGIVVRDTGIGISTQSINKVFDRFYMVNDPQGELHLGSGVGLALVKSLVLLHKGTIAIYSERDRGTDILVGFPGSKSEYTPSEFVEEDKTEIRSIEVDSYQVEQLSNPLPELNTHNDEYLSRENKRILLAEDNDDLRRLIAETLTQQYDVCEACNGVVASQLLQQMEVDLIISDVMMPQKDGITLCREVKEDISTSHIPFIMMTVKGGLENRIEGIDSGADAFLEKPINFKLLLLTINNLFKQQNNVREFYAKNFFAESSEVNVNQRDNEFMKQLVNVIESKIDQAGMDINYIAVELAMSRSKLYAKVKNLTGKSIVEFIRYYRLRKAVRLLVDENLPIREVMERVGIESQSYFTRAFKKEFGENPTTFVAKSKQK